MTPIAQAVREPKPKKRGRPREVEDPTSVTFLLPADVYDNCYQEAQRRRTELAKLLREVVSNWVSQQKSRRVLTTESCTSQK